MGNCGSNQPLSEEDKKKREEIRINKELGKSLKQQNLQEQKVVKMLLLGAGEAGKSTIFKQVRIMKKEDFSDQERQEFKRQIHANVISAIRDICRACLNILGIPFEKEECKSIASRFVDLQPKETDPLLIKEEIKKIWSDAATVDALNRRSEYNLIDSAEYFLGQNFDRIMDRNYIPTNTDILHCRKATNGIVSLEYKQDSTFFKVYDVGGQRGKRKKWIRCFDGVTAIIFVAALSEYDQELMEIKGKNRMLESLALFAGITKLPWFRKTPIILFLNKRDIFEKKIVQSDLSKVFIEYTGGKDVENGILFIRSLYEERMESGKENFYCHITTATDEKTMPFIFKATVDIIIKRALANYGLSGSI